MEQLEQYKRVFESFHEAIYIVNKDRKILYFNPIASLISGFSQEETEGFFCYDNILNHVDEKGKNLCFSGCPLTHAIRENVVTDHIVYLHHKLGYRVRVHVRAIPIIEDGDVVGAIEVFTDDTEKNLMQEEIALLKQMSFIDPLTGLYQRRFLTDRLDGHLDLHGHSNIGILFIDIDNFKTFNDTFGHDYGDVVLRTVAKTILYQLKQKDVVVRYGGEEIVVILLDVSEENMLNVAEMLCALIAQSHIRYQEHPMKVTVSIGATLVKNQEQIKEAIKRADQAMYRAKKQGKNQVCLL
jgi:diguanylate cyclase (GGDEF)-like protein/PAS domain S-box-containing protein